MSELIHKELSEAIIGAAMTVLNVLRPGLDEGLKAAQYGMTAAKIEP